jgi:hypothetical protein
MTAVSNLTAPLASLNHSVACPNDDRRSPRAWPPGLDFLVRRSGKTQNWAQFPRAFPISSPHTRRPGYSRTLARARARVCLSGRPSYPYPYLLAAHSTAWLFPYVVPVSRACARVSEREAFVPVPLSPRRTLDGLVIPVRSASLARVRVCLGVGRRSSLSLLDAWGRPVRTPFTPSL